MPPRMLLYVFSIWILFLGADISSELLEDALAPENTLAPTEPGGYGGHILSVFILILFVLIVIYAFINSVKIRYYSNEDLLFIGVLWSSMSILYGFVYRHYFANIPWSVIFEDYDFSTGRLKGFVLLLQLFAPVVLGVRRKRRSRRGGYRIDRYR